MNAAKQQDKRKTQTESKDRIDKVTRKLVELMREQFFGEVGISFQNGSPHTVKVHRTYKVDQL